MRLAVHRMPSAEGLPLPSYATEGAAGADLHAALETEMTLDPGRHALIPTGLSLTLPKGYEAQIRPRSGLALHHGITVLNAPGTIDSDYRGEVGVILINLGQEAFTLRRGDRIAQIVFAKTCRAAFTEQPSITEEGPEMRGAGGFGSTGGFG